MNVQGSKILILGGWGLVGSAVCRERPEGEHDLCKTTLHVENAGSRELAVFDCNGQLLERTQRPHRV